jgi:hypothetical protein
MALDPYKTPACNPINNTELNDFEELRYEYLKHEKRVRSLAPFFYALSAAIVTLAIFALFNPVTPVFGIIIMPLAYIPFWTAKKIKTLESNARIPLLLLAVAGLAAAPIGPIVTVILLFLLFSPSGIMLFSDEYIEAINETPHIECRVSTVCTIIAWVTLALFLLSFTFTYFFGQHT